MFIINWINLAWSRPMKPTNCIHVEKCKTLPLMTFFTKNLHCSLTVVSSSLLVLNTITGNNERVCGKKNW